MAELDDFGSDSSDDDDYVPENDSGDDEEISDAADDDDEKIYEKAKTGKECGSKSKRKKKGDNNFKRKRKGGIKIDEEAEKHINQSGPDEINSVECEEQSDGEKIDEEVAKLKADALWAVFKKDVEPKAKNLKDICSTKTIPVSAMANQTTKSLENKQKITITKVFDFAGEEIRVTEEIDANSKEAQKIEKFKNTASGSSINDQNKQSSSVKKPAGLGSVLSKIGGKKKMSTLEKSRLDWTDFKTEEGIDNDLRTFNKGKEGFLERQAFLQRTDERQFEVERGLRQASRNPR